MFTWTWYSSNMDFPLSECKVILYLYDWHRKSLACFRLRLVAFAKAFTPLHF